MKAPLFLAAVLSAAACAPLPPGGSQRTAQFPEFRVDPNWPRPLAERSGGAF